MPFNPSHFYGLRESQSHAEHLVLVFSSCTDKNAMSLHFAPVADINFSPKCRSHAKRNNKPGRRGSKGRESASGRGKLSGIIIIVELTRMSVLMRFNVKL